MIRPLFFSLLCAISFGAVAQSVIVDGVAAVVGSEIILLSDISMQRQALEQEGQTVSDCQLMKGQLLEKLLIHHADLDSVTVSIEEIDDAIDRRLQQLVAQIGSEQRLEEYYKKSALEIKEELRPMMTNQMTAQRMQMTLTADIDVTPMEVEEVIQALHSDSLPLIGTEVELAQITLEPIVSEASSKEAIDKLDGLRTRILEGSSFSTMAILYSEDPGSNKNGGAYKGIKRGQFVKEFEAIAFNLRPGEISQPFKTEYGYHIVQLQAKRGEELDLRHILVKAKVEQSDLDFAKARLDSVRDLILMDSISFEDAAMRISSDENSKLNGGVLMNPSTGDLRWKADDLDQGLFYAIDQLAEGEIGKVTLIRQPDGQELFRMVLLKKRTAPHRANLNQDFSMLKTYVENQKRQSVMDAWVEIHREETHIRLNENFKDCGL